MQSSTRPPVDEVVISFGIDRIDALSGPELSQILGDLWPSHRTVQVQPPYSIPPEFPQLSATPAFPLALQQQYQYSARYWFTSDDSTEVIQVQPDYIALNWRRRGSAEYPGHDLMREKFLNILALIDSRLDQRINPVSVELTYVNIFDASQVHARDLTLFPDPSASFEVGSISLFRDMEISGSFCGRTHVNLTRGYDPEKNDTTFLLNLTARSAPFDDPNETHQGMEYSLDFLGQAHGQILEIFGSLLTSDARRKWGLA